MKLLKLGTVQILVVVVTSMLSKPAVAWVPKLIRSATMPRPVAFQRFLATNWQITTIQAAAYRCRTCRWATTSSSSDPPPAETAVEDRDAVQAAREARKYVTPMLLLVRCFSNFPHMRCFLAERKRSV
jgi:hypothetical protein